MAFTASPRSSAFANSAGTVIGIRRTEKNRDR